MQQGNEELDNGTISPGRHAAPNFGTTALSWTNKKWVITARSWYSQGKTFDELPEEEKNKPEIYDKNTEGLPYSPDWSIINIKSAYQLQNNIRLQAGIEHITDVRYRPYSSGIAAPGRNIVISLHVRI